MTEQRDLFGLNLNSSNDPPTEEVVTLVLISHGDVGDSVKFSQSEDGKTFLLPTSQISISPTEGLTSKVGHPKYPYVQVRMPIWLAKDRGLI